MKTRCVFLIGVLAATLTSWAEEMTTLTGETYTNVVVLRYDNKGFFIRHDGGDTPIPYKAILPELRARPQRSEQVEDLGRGDAHGLHAAGTGHRGQRAIVRMALVEVVSHALPEAVKFDAGTDQVAVR